MFGWLAHIIWRRTWRENNQSEFRVTLLNSLNFPCLSKVKVIATENSIISSVQSLWCAVSALHRQKEKFNVRSMTSISIQMFKLHQSWHRNHFITRFHRFTSFIKQMSQLMHIHYQWMSRINKFCKCKCKLSSYKYRDFFQIMTPSEIIQCQTQKQIARQTKTVCQHQVCVACFDCTA